MKMTWKCNLCGDIVTSDTEEQHTCDFCLCGQSMIDLEDGYSRQSGDITILKKE